MRAAAYYQGFQARAERVKDDLLGFLLEQKRAGSTVVGYGAAAKGNTLLNYAGVRPDLLPFVADASPHKQGRFLPGARIPVGAEALSRGAAGLRAGAAVEPARGDHRAARLHARVGRALGHGRAGAAHRLSRPTALFCGRFSRRRHRGPPPRVPEGLLNSETCHGARVQAA